jgi:hypothetical protein
MKLALFTIVLTAALVWSQAVKGPGHCSKYASAGKNSGSSGVTTPAPKTEPLAAQLAKIEQQGAHVPSPSATSRPAATAKPIFPKAPATQNKNRPMKLAPRSQPTRSNQPH